MSNPEYNSDSTPNGNLEWGTIKDVPFSGSVSETKVDFGESVEAAREDLKQVGFDLQKNIQEKIENKTGVVKAGDGGDAMCWRLADGVWNSFDADMGREERRSNALNEIKNIQNFMFLEEASGWLPEGSAAEKRLVELYDKTYDIANGDIEKIATNRNNLSDNVTKTGIELSPMLRDINAEIGATVPKYRGGEEDRAVNMDLDTRKREFVAFAKERLGEESDEYRLILKEVYQIGREDYWPPHGKDQVPLTHYMTTLGGTWTPMRVAASLTIPFGE